MSTTFARSHTPIAPVAQMPSHHQRQHVVQFYTDDGFLLDALSGFVGSALAIGDAAVVIATPANSEGLVQRLKGQGIDTAKAIKKGRCILLDAAETLAKFMVDGLADPALFAKTVGEVLARVRTAAESENPRIAVFGELVALLWAEGKLEAAVQVEELWNNLAQTHSFSLLCAYPITGFSKGKHTQPFLKICALHSGVVPSESYTGLTSEEERLRGIAYLQQRVQALEREEALRQSEERFRLLVEAVQDYAIFILDREGRISTWNRGAERIKGYRASEIVGKHFSCFYPEHDLRSGKPQSELEVAAREGRFEDEGWRIRKDGSRFWANVVITALRDDQGRLYGYAKVTRDFTERMRAEEALRKANRDLQQQVTEKVEAQLKLRRLSLHLLRTQDEERRRIGRDLHDSLGQYLAMLKVNLDSLQLSSGSTEKEADQRLAQCIRLAEESVKEVRTISYLLYPPMLEELGLKSAIPWYLEGFTKRSGIETTFDICPDFGRPSRDVELALFRVLQESLTNVHRHSGSPTAHVRVLRKDGAAILEVSDKGKGIRSDILEQSGQDWPGAVGVGLRGMDERMRQLGGRLEVSSTEQGTIITATVPAEDSSSTAGATGDEAA
jgi:PAS domain S-box-containing protein